MTRIIFLLSFIIATIGTAQVEAYDKLLKNTVDNQGYVDYTEISKKHDILDTYISYLAATTPDTNWSDDKTKAFWINAYNAYTLRLIIDHYPIKSIMTINVDGKDAWNIPFATVGGTHYTLNHIEHEILRKGYDDPRIHVGVNCASMSCPKLANFAFTEDNIDSELERLMKEYINDPQRNSLSNKKLRLSKILEWFKEDFTKNGSLIDYLNRYSDIEINSRARVRYLEYDWNLNEK